jgi:hypothetical protein
MSIVSTDCQSWIGSTLIDGDDCRVGTIEAVYFDEQTDLPQWMVVRTGLLGTRHSFVPLGDARLAGSVVSTPYDKREIDQAPKLDIAEDIDGDQVVELYRYYGLPVDADRPDLGETLAARVLSYVG